MKQTASFLLLLCLYAISFAQSPNIVKEIDSVYSQLYRTNRFNGTVLYAEKGKVLYKKAFGITDARTGKPLSTNSSFNLASVTKQFIAMGIMILSEKGLIAFDDPATKFIPELPYKNVSIRKLLNHTSGIPEYFDLYRQYRTALDTLTNEKMIKLFAVHSPKPDFETGTKWQYCNTNYVLLAAIIERISKEPLQNFMSRNITIPLGLKDTYVYEVLMPAVPANHVYGFSEMNGQRILNDLTDVDGVTGDGNIYSSVEDLYKWDQSLYTSKLVKPATFSQALTPALLKDGSTYPYGFGWGLDKTKDLYTHTGSWAGFRNLIGRDLKNHRTIIVLSSGENETGRSIGKLIFTAQPYSIPNTFLITNVKLIDGTGTPARNASVRVEGNTIIAVGDLKPFEGEPVTDGGGKILAPGFIDSHSHVGGSLTEHPEALASINQGVTTIVSGQDGWSDPADSLKEGFKKIPKAINVATYTGHTTIREMIMGHDQLNRPATREELEKIKKLLVADMQKGSLGLSTGLEYEGAFYSDRNEVIELAKTTAAGGGKYISHIRSEDITRIDALDEIINIGRIAKVPVQISHIKIALKEDWGSATGLLAQLDRARQEGIDITADCYPYEYWSSTIRVLFPNKDFDKIEGATYAVEHLFDPEASVMVKFLADTNYKGKTVGDIAKMRQETSAQTLMYLVAAAEKYEKQHPDEGGAETIMAKSMSEEDLIPLLSWPHTNICSDGSNGGHPRGYGSFTRVLGRYVREKKIMTLENAIYKMTALTAEQVGLKNIGIIAPGYDADLVLFDPETVKDNSSIQNSKALSEGILQVWVNGILVYKDHQSTKQFPGKFLSR